jgi:hypothetical protein
MLDLLVALILIVVAIAAIVLVRPSIAAEAGNKLEAQAEKIDTGVKAETAKIESDLTKKL